MNPGNLRIQPRAARRRADPWWAASALLWTCALGSVSSAHWLVTVGLLGAAAGCFLVAWGIEP